MKTLVVAGIGTEVGKTVVSAILVEALKADYWKPVQAGDLENSDSFVVQKLVSTEHLVFHLERYRLNSALSPHAAAEIDGVELRSDDLSLPETKNTLVIELAGGLMVPINAEELNVDLIVKWKAPVVLVSRNYLGSINHTLLSLDILKKHHIPVLGIIFNGDENKSTEEFILNYSKIPCIGRVEKLNELNKETIKAQSEKLKNNLQKIILK